MTPTNFQGLVLEAPVAVVVYFWAAWSEPCAALTPKLEAIVRSVPGLVRLAKVDVDANPQLASALKVTGVPTILGTIAGKSFGALPGPVPDAQLREFMQGLLTAADGAGMLPGGSGDRLQRAAEAVVEAGEMVDAGEHDAARKAILPPVIEELRGARDRLAEQLTASAASDPQAAQVLAAAGTSGPLFELDDLVARGVAALGALKSCRGGEGGAACPRVRATDAPPPPISRSGIRSTVRALLASAAELSPGTPEVATLRTEAQALADELRTKYRAHVKHADVQRALAAVDLSESAGTGASGASWGFR